MPFIVFAGQLPDDVKLEEKMAKISFLRLRRIKKTILSIVFLSIAFSQTVAFGAQTGKIVGWGSQVVGADLDSGFVTISAGSCHNLGLKSNGSLVTWRDNSEGQCNVPSPNKHFVAIG